MIRNNLILGSIALIAFLMLSIIGNTYVKNYAESERVFSRIEQIEHKLTIDNLDHDILVSNVSKICDEKLTGFDTYVGPTGWPWTSKVMWEVALYEDTDYYYGRLIFHEYILWFSFDDPYIVCKIPKANVGDLKYNEKHRWQVLWDITYTTLRTYNYEPYMYNSVVQHINGYTVAFGDYSCKYEKYFVICDGDNRW